MTSFTKLLKIAPMLLCAYAGSASALVINFNHAAGMDAQALAGFQSAANRWTNVLRDNVQVNLDINFAVLDPGVLGGTFATSDFYLYGDVRNALVADASSMHDKKAVANLNAGPCMGIYMNGTASNPNGSGSSTPWLDNNCSANNFVMNLNRANARALGLEAAVDTVSDGGISFSSSFTWDFDPSNGITAGAFDFIGVATHEIGHALGFVSGVDILDFYGKGGYQEDAFVYVAPADLFRCSADSKAAGADLDWSADTRKKYFSLDGCKNTLATFSTGTDEGDGNQASHWQDDLGLGILDPTAAPGELLQISPLDRAMFDVIGWDVVPEPGSTALFLLGLAGLAGLRRRAN